MDGPFTPHLDLSQESRIANDLAARWGITLEPHFKYSNVSFVAPTSDGAVLKVPWGGWTTTLETSHKPSVVFNRSWSLVSTSFEFGLGQ
jgi:hypothetical protein